MCQHGIPWYYHRGAAVLSSGTENTENTAARQIKEGIRSKPPNPMHCMEHAYSSKDRDTGSRYLILFGRSLGAYAPRAIGLHGVAIPYHTMVIPYHRHTRPPWGGQRGRGVAWAGQGQGVRRNMAPRNMGGAGQGARRAM